MTTSEFPIIDSQRKAVEMCIERNVPFALFAFPGHESQFVASLPSDDEGRNEWEYRNDDWEGFIINFFANDEEYVAGVRSDFNAPSIIEFLENNPVAYPASLIEPPCTESTGRLKYLAMATSIISRLKREGGKTVLSRVIVETSRENLVDVALRYFNEFPDTFRYICFTQETGLWFGATPETVVEYYPDTNELFTMALAGTMGVDETEWSKKNINEHLFVKQYIIDRLADLGADEIQEASPEDVTFGKVKHLCTHIKAIIRPKSLRGMLYALSPTPAVAGTPRDRAIAEIFISETHSRLCYTGFVGVKTRDALYAAANLRCATVRTEPDSPPGIHNYYIFAGGGLTAKSVPEEEWAEGNDKTFLLRKAVNPEITE